MPAYVYQIDIPDNAAGVSVIDPVEFVAKHQANPLAMISYHHDGDPKLILAIVVPVAHASMLSIPPARPPGLAGGVAAAPKVSSELETMVNALRDAEILIQGVIPRAWVIDRFDIL